MPRPDGDAESPCPSLGTGNTENYDSTVAEAEVPKKKWNKLWTVCIFILVVEMCERLCYYTLAGSMRNFLEDAGPVHHDTRGIEASAAVSISSCFSMLSYLTCIM